MWRFTFRVLVVVCLNLGLCIVAQTHHAFAQINIARAVDDTAYAKIRSEKNPESKRQLILAFEKTFPKSNHLAEAYIEMSRILVTQSNFSSAVDYAQKAVNAVAQLKAAENSGNTEPKWQLWVNSLETSSRDNLNWTKQMMAWQMQQLRSSGPKR
jgi:hypothetical protein